MKVCFVKHNLETNKDHIISTCEDFLSKLSVSCGFPIEIGTVEDLQTQKLSCILVGSGGAERNFKELYKKLKGPFYLLTIPAFNSLAASFEIKGFLEKESQCVEILHGEIESIAKRLSVIQRASDAICTLRKGRIGAIGDPTSLIASKVDPSRLQEGFGLEVVNLELSELVAEYHKGGYPESSLTKELLSKTFDKEEIVKALNVYGAMKRIIDKYSLSGVTVRCFDLLGLIRTTGCLALALLNAEGIPAACEGDSKTLVSMMVIKALTGRSSFMANPSAMDFNKGQMILAHCTIPLDMVDDYSLVSHFESGIGVAVSADLHPCEVTLFKCDDTGRNYYVDTANLLDTLHRSDLCRTQFLMSPKKGPEYLKEKAICNHQLIIKGNWKEEVDEFFKMLKEYRV